MYLTRTYTNNVFYIWYLYTHDTCTFQIGYKSMKLNAPVHSSTSYAEGWGNFVNSNGRFKPMENFDVII